LEIRRSALIGRPATTTFDVIEAAEHYPAFLPWCAGAVVLARDATVVVARITVGYRGVRFSFTTRNPKDRPRFMAIRLAAGPFRRFDGEWHLTELAADACKIEFGLRYEFDRALVSRLASPVFSGITDTLVDAFARRVEQLPAAAPERGSDTLPTEGTTT
jgi:ribosome-associated toxin RatA of RatAB toxin-antitoxin module